MRDAEREPMNSEQSSFYDSLHHVNGKYPKSDVLETDEDTIVADTYADGSIYPYNMPDEVDIREDAQTVFEWIRKLDRGSLIIEPEFQRNLVWKAAQRSQFIESVLINIPLPALYVNQRVDGRYIVVDGLQRTSTLNAYLKDEFVLSDLKLLRNLNGRRFSTLDPKDQARIEDRKLLVYVIKPTVPLPMVYDIFHRINTGGTQLTRQEIRNCFYIGNATRLLKKLSQQEYFKQAIDHGISPKRMKDREAILRFLAFYIQGYENEYKDDMDAFLGEAMKRINHMSESEIHHLEDNFERTVKWTYEFFKRDNFRLMYESKRGPVNIALMETICYFFASNSNEFITSHRQSIACNYHRLVNMPEFIDAVRFSTGDKKRVIARFSLAKSVLAEPKC